MTTAAWIILIVAGIAVAHPLIMRAIMEAVQPIRLEMADLGRELVARDDVPEHHKKIVAAIVRDAFEWQFMIFVFFVTPGFAMIRLVGRPLRDPFDDVHSHEAREMMERFVELFAVSTAAANPFFFFLVSIEFSFLFVLLRLLKVINGNAGSVRSAAQRVVLRAEERMVGSHATP